MNHTTCTWSEIRNLKGRPLNSPINELIDYVIESELSEYLYVATFLNNIRIGRSKNFNRNDGELTVEHWGESKEVLFNYYDAEFSKPWKKICSCEDIIPTFKHVISKRLRWVQNAES